MTDKKNGFDTQAVVYHIVGWSIWITYEVSLANAIRQNLNHFADYLFHYILYALLFYFHCFVALRTTNPNFRTNHILILTIVALEVLIYYMLAVVMNKVLMASGLPVNIPDTNSRLFNLATIYRCVLILMFSTAFRIGLNLLEEQRRIRNFQAHEFAAEKERSDLENKLMKSELDFLRSQIDPHFIFNSLSSFYYRLRKSDKVVADDLMALSEHIHYSFSPKARGTDTDLRGEVQHIRKYLMLQEKRFKSKVDFIADVDGSDIRVPPLLLISLVENIFKHGELSNVAQTPLVELRTDHGKLYFRTRNKVRSDSSPGHGIGMSNTVRRLEALYPNRYRLECKEEDGIYELNLEINLT